MATKVAKTLPVIGVSTLGCPKNLVDTENIIGILHGAGYQITSDHDKADISLVNTCTFIEDSSNESAEVLGELADDGKKLIITGCMAQRFKGDLFDELPEAQAVVGTGNVKDILDVVKKVTEKINAGQDAKIVCVDEKPESVADAATPRMRTQVSPSVYIKIAEGCDHRCAFCIIPHLRGDMNSRSIEDIVEEAKAAVENGAQELVLVSQDSSAYGTDIYKRRALADLLEALATQSGAKWIRVMYAYPTELDEEMLEVIAKHDNLMNYIDIPLQHASQEVLLRMKRPPTVRDTVAMVKDKLPDACIRTVFIVGFPGETEEDFEELYNFVKESRFDRVGVFTYSKELGTTAYDLPDQVDEEIKEARRDKLMRLQQRISLEKNQEMIARELTMLVEEIAEQEDGNFQIIGRSFRDAPEIDGQLYASLPADEILPAPGSFVQAWVTACDEYDLFVDLN
ncbi:MAG: 30S ribosomal protein S12 methylthiotransferase RimO [Candidatus Melainabacteria bacterium]|nr:30S ribosomal protein S12 methylthiotransferase RimO [Candidatus Melainabacteria bacterium]